jgi:hypothetical protein
LQGLADFKELSLIEAENGELPFKA